MASSGHTELIMWVMSETKMEAIQSFACREKWLLLDHNDD